jgi:hypothetical protein
LRPSLLTSRRNGEGPAGGGVEGIAIPGMGRRVAAVETEPADDEVRALWGSAPARLAAFGWPATDSLGLPDSPTESDSHLVAWDTLAKAALGRISASSAGPVAGGTAVFAAGTSGPALADWGFVGSGQTFDAAGGVSVAGAALAVVASDRISRGATGGLGSGTGRVSAAAAGATLPGPAGRASRAGGTFASVAAGALTAATGGTLGSAATGVFGRAAGGALTLGAGGTFASAAGRALTSGPGGTWALGGGSLTSGAGGFFVSPAGRAVANAFAAATVGTSAVPGPASLGPARLAGAGPCPFAAGAFAASAPGAVAASSCQSSTVSDGAPGEVDLSCALTCCR